MSADSPATPVDASVVADLHAHTTVSDGTMTLDEVPAVARAADVEWVAVTDHDRIHPGVDAPVVIVAPDRIARGVELRVAAVFGRLDPPGSAVTHTHSPHAPIPPPPPDRP